MYVPVSTSSRCKILMLLAVMLYIRMWINIFSPCARGLITNTYPLVAAVSPFSHAKLIAMVIEIRTAALQMLPLISYVMKPQTGDLWICSVPNKVIFLL